MGTSQRSQHPWGALMLLLLVLAGPVAALAAAAAGQAGGAAKGVTSGSHTQQQVSASPAAAAPSPAGAAPAAPAPGPAANSDPPPKRVAGVLLGLYQSYAGPVLKAASNFINFGGMAAEPSPLTLPQCKQTNVLLNEGLFPGAGAWASLTAEQQARHPVNLVMMQVRQDGSVCRTLAELGKQRAALVATAAGATAAPVAVTTGATVAAHWATCIAPSQDRHPQHQQSTELVGLTRSVDFCCLLSCPDLSWLSCVRLPTWLTGLSVTSHPASLAWGQT